jgi:hypothetical protein
MYQLTDKDYLKQLRSQIDFLKSDIEEYMNGKEHFALKIASTIRTLFYKSKMSTPILPDLPKKYGLTIRFKGRDQSKIDSYVVLYTGFTIGNKTPRFDAPFLIDKEFDEYWDEIVYIEGKIRYTRSQLIMWAANKLGGSHVDPKIPPELLHLVNGTIKLVSSRYGEESIINQVTYEMAVQVLMILNDLFPKLEEKIK